MATASFMSGSMNFQVACFIEDVPEISSKFQNMWFDTLTYDLVIRSEDDDRSVVVCSKLQMKGFKKYLEQDNWYDAWINSKPIVGDDRTILQMCKDKYWDESCFPDIW